MIDRFMDLLHLAVVNNSFMLGQPFMTMLVVLRQPFCDQLFCAYLWFGMIFFIESCSNDAISCV